LEKVEKGEDANMPIKRTLFTTILDHLKKQSLETIKGVVCIDAVVFASPEYDYFAFACYQIAKWDTE
jgi:hypothetical protein